LCAYAAAVTVAFSALLRSLVHGMDWVVHEIEQVSSGAAHQAGLVMREAEAVVARAVRPVEFADTGSHDWDADGMSLPGMHS
jgi:hypothetical protein